MALDMATVSLAFIVYFPLIVGQYQVRSQNVNSKGGNISGSVLRSTIDRSRRPEIPEIFLDRYFFESLEIFFPPKAEIFWEYFRI